MYNTTRHGVNSHGLDHRQVYLNDLDYRIKFVIGNNKIIKKKTKTLRTTNDDRRDILLLA